MPLPLFLASFALAAPPSPQASDIPDAIRFEPAAVARLTAGEALPAAFDAVGGRGLRVVARRPLGSVPANDVHLMLEHPTMPARHASLILREGRLTGAIALDGDLRVAVTGIEAGLSRKSIESGARDLPCGVDGRFVAPRDEREPADGGVAGGCDDGSRVDVLVLYTDAAVVQAGGETQMLDWINWAIADSNAIYSSTGIAVMMRLVGASRASGYVEDAASMANDLYALRDPADGKLDQALPLRNSTAADMVALIRADGGGACGIAWLLGTDPASESYAYSVTALGCFTNRTFTHELGHNMGCCHAPGDGGGCTSGGVFPYSVGHRFNGVSGTQYRTVMAYSPGTRIPRFSSPTTIYDGTPTGLVDRDNAASINITRFTFANFRCDICPGDVNGDNVRDGADLAAVLGNWGTTTPATDLNSDGTTNASDLALLLGNWGACP